MTQRDDEIEALKAIMRLYNGRLPNFHPTRMPEAIEAFLRTRPKLPELHAALIAVLARIITTERRGGRDTPADKTGHACEETCPLA